MEAARAAPFSENPITTSDNPEIKGPLEAFHEKINDVWTSVADLYFRFADDLSDKILVIAKGKDAITDDDRVIAKKTIYLITIMSTALGASSLAMSGTLFAGAACLAAEIGLIHFSTQALKEESASPERKFYSRLTYQTTFYLNAMNICATLTGGLFGLAALVGAVYFATKIVNEEDASKSKVSSGAGAALCTMCVVTEMTNGTRIAANLFKTTLSLLTVLYALYRTDSKKAETPIEEEEEEEEVSPSPTTNIETPASTAVPTNADGAF